MHVIDRWFLAWRDSYYELLHQFDGADWAYVLALLMPFLCFADLPRYLFGPLLLLIRRLCGLRRSDDQHKEQYLKNKPAISICITGQHMADQIGSCIRSISEFNYENFEVIIINNDSTNQDFAVVQDYIPADKIKVFSTAEETAAPNLASFYASGEIIIFADVAMTFDRLTLFHLAGAFYDQRVGVVAGNIKVRNPGDNQLTRLQGAEYVLSIGVWKEALDTMRLNYLASGVLVAFRKAALDAVGGWDPGLASDAGLSLKMKRCGYQLAFAPRAIAMCTVTTSLSELLLQRLWWDRGLLRSYTSMRSGMWKYWLFRWRNLIEMGQEVLFSIIGACAFVLFAVYLLWLDPWALLLVYLTALLVFLLASAFGLGVALLLSERRRSEVRYLISLPLLPFYKEMLRWVRIVAFAKEVLKPGEKPPGGADSLWAYTRKW